MCIDLGNQQIVDHFLFFFLIPKDCFNVSVQAVDHFVIDIAEVTNLIVCLNGRVAI